MYNDTPLDTNKKTILVHGL